MKSHRHQASRWVRTPSSLAPPRVDSLGEVSATLALSRPTAHPALGVGLVATSACLFSLNGTVSKLLMQGGFDAPQLTTFRSAGAFLGLLLLSAAVKPGLGRLR